MTGWGADNFSIEMVEYTMKIMKRLRKNPKTVLDLCCGTGSALQLFHERNLKVTGIDGSKSMLSEARKIIKHHLDTIPQEMYDELNKR